MIFNTTCAVVKGLTTRVCSSVIKRRTVQATQPTVDNRGTSALKRNLWSTWVSLAFQSNVNQEMQYFNGW